MSFVSRQDSLNIQVYDLQDLRNSSDLRATAAKPVERIVRLEPRNDSSELGARPSGTLQQAQEAASATRLDSYDISAKETASVPTGLLLDVTA